MSKFENPFFLRLVSDTAADDSDKTLTVDSGKNWHVHWIHVALVTSGDVGNRQLELRVTDDSDNVIFQISAGAVQAASTTRQYEFTPVVALSTAAVDGKLLVPIPPLLVLASGYKVRVLDNAAIAATADDMTIRMAVSEYSTKA